MGMIWRSAMPLLTTLAALVIIVHCVEEDLGNQYSRHDVRPRILDPDTASNDQLWRAIEEDPVIHQSRNAEGWEDIPQDEPPKRRRPGRKRKRRPQPDPNEEIQPQARFAYPDEPARPYYDVDSDTRQTTQMPGRRRRKPEARPIRWTDDEIKVAERPLRRRALERKRRPSVEAWPELSEFNKPEEEFKTDYSNDYNTNVVQAVTPQANIEAVFEHGGELMRPRTKRPKFRNRDSINVPAVERNEPIRESNVPEDKSLSDFSPETYTGVRATDTEKDDTDSSNRKYIDKTSGASLDREKSQADPHAQYKDSKLFLEIDKTTERKKKSPNMYLQCKSEQELKGAEKLNDVVADCNDAQQLLKRKTAENIAWSKSFNKIYAYTARPNQTQLTEARTAEFWMDQILMDHQPKQLSLKDILKRSNGTSLSEILQQHNLSLADLLHGKEQAVSIFNNQESIEAVNKNIELKEDVSGKPIDINVGNNKKEELEQTLVNSETKYVRTEPVTETFLTTELPQTGEVDKSDDEVQPTATLKPLAEIVSKISNKRRFQTGLRKKMRMRPMVNVTNTYKGQLSRDLIALNARKYSHRRNTTKSRDWKDVMPAMRQKPHRGITQIETTTMTLIPEETTIAIEIESNNNPIEEARSQSDIETKLDDIDMDETESTASVPVTEITTETPINCTDKPIAVVTMARPTAVSTGLRRQAFNNRLKRKRMKQRNSTTESPDDIIKHLFGMGDLVSSSEFIARTQEPKTTIEDGKGFTSLEDFMTTEIAVKAEAPTVTKIITTKHTTTAKSIIQSTTEESAKIEIEEIFNDTQTSAKLSRILRERNMTLSELVEHRERGSSHVHLADIFHNASKEPNPPEPFLSKSLLEPISKETYPLRALLDANLHDPNGKVTTIDPNLFNNINIPVVMDYRNNVNENAENMGIMSLFNNFTKNITKSIAPIEPEEITTAIPEIVPNVTKANDTVRESRVLGEIQDDVVSWNEIFSLMGRNRNNDTEEFASNQPFKKITLEEDAEGDGLLVLEDLQHLKDFENNIASASGSDEALEVNSFESHDTHHVKGILDKIPSQTKSVTVATASIAGLAMILFLLTYAAFKWKQQRSMIRKKRSMERDERIPTPVFENRKGHKNHSSTRSMSPMLQTSNIYTLNTLDSQNGKESPDYMWDSLRKPFQ